MPLYTTTGSCPGFRTLTYVLFSWGVTSPRPTITVAWLGGGVMPSTNPTFPSVQVPTTLPSIMASCPAATTAALALATLHTPVRSPQMTCSVAISTINRCLRKNSDPRMASFPMSATTILASSTRAPILS